MTRSIKETIERDTHTEGSLSAVVRKLLSQDRLNIDQLDQMVDEWTATRKSPDEVERVRKRNMKLLEQAGGISIFNVKQMYRLYKLINPKEANVKITYLGYVANIQLAKGKLPRISLVKGD
jgi:hypothetical protein